MIKKVPDLHPDLLADLEALTMMFREVASVALASAYEMGRRSASASPAAAAKENESAPAQGEKRLSITSVEENESETEEPWEPVNCATLAPLTPLQFKVLNVFVAARGEYVASGEIDKRAGFQGAFAHVAPLRAKGYIRARQMPGMAKNRHAYDIAFFGAPTVLRDGFELRGKKLSGQQRTPAAAAAPTIPPSGVDAPPAPAPRPAAPIIAPAAVTPPPPAPAPPVSAPPEPKKSYPPVASLRKSAAPPPRAPHTPGSLSATQAAFGADGNGGRGPGADVGRIKVSTYLIRKGHSCSSARGGWQVDGRFMDKDDVLEIVNRHRRAADLPPALADDLE